MDTTSSGRGLSAQSAKPARPPGASRPGTQLIDALRIMLKELPEGSTVLDCGGGSGSLAVPLAVEGADVTVLDISIDALSTLERRAAEAGVGHRIAGIQAEVEELGTLIAPASFDVVLLHGILASATDPRAAFRSAAVAVRPGGFVSVVVANPAAGVLARAFSGDVASALAEIRADVRDARDDAETGTSLAGLAGWAEQEGLSVRVAQGLASFSSTVPGAVLSASANAIGLIEELDRLTATRSPYRDIAAALHLIGQRPRLAAGSAHEAGSARDPAAHDPAAHDASPR